MKQITVTLPDGSYTVSVGRGLLCQASSYMDLSRRVFILTDSGVPRAYADAIAAQAPDAVVCTVPEGEGSKSFATLEHVLRTMLDASMTRHDCLVAVGGGVVGDLGALAAALYMRGIDFYNVPTTLLAQVDASVGGKCAVNLGQTKNPVGVFHQPKAVLIDPDTLKSLPARHISSGFAEVIKMAISLDKDLFEQLEQTDIAHAELTDIIARAVQIKGRVVEQDEREGGLRRVLNFGHTIGHGIEAAEELRGLYHGECVALGMIPMCSDDVKTRLLPVLAKFDLPITHVYDKKTALSYIKHDKKAASDGDMIVITVKQIGSFCTKHMTVHELEQLIKD